MGTAWGPEIILRRLFIARVPKALVLCLLLILFGQNIDATREWRFLELFAGQANVSRACRDSCFRGASMDLDYGGRAMDLSTDVGMALALVGVLKLQARSLGLLAPVCYSMGFLAASQTKRSFIVPLGDLGNPHVFSGNLLAVRAILICWVLAALGHTFLLEQPAGSRFRFFPQWRFFCKYICTVFRQGLWMRHYGSESCKHTFLWSNSSGVRHLSLGRLTKEQRETAVPLATKNIDQSGKRRATGVKKRLKKSQVYTMAFGKRIAQLLPTMPKDVQPLRNPQDPGPSSVATQLASLVQSELWDLGQMESVVSYLSRNRHLDIPPSFAEALRGELAP